MNPACLVLWSLLTAVTPAEGDADRFVVHVASDYWKTTWGERRSLAARLAALERAPAGTRSPLILALGLDRRPEARPWLVSLARGDAFARAWLAAPPDELERAAARLSLGFFGGLAAENELTSLLREGAGDAPGLRAGTLAGLAVLWDGPRASAPSLATRRELLREADKPGLAPDLRALAAALARATGADPLLRGGDLEAWEDLARRARGRERPADLGGSGTPEGLDDWVEILRRDEGEGFALVSARKPGSSTARVLPPRTRLLLASVANRVLTARPLVRALEAALKENAERPQVQSPDAR